MTSTRWPTAVPDKPDFTSKYNTHLPPEKEKVFQAWVRLNKREGDLADYDLRGAWQEGAEQASNGHFTDKFKKPNHPTFSDESIYSGKDGIVGGKWKATDGDVGPWTFEPSPDNFRYQTKEQLQEYFEKQEEGSSIAWDALSKPKPK